MVIYNIISLSQLEKQQFDLPLSEAVFGIDLFIGEEDMLNKGLGTLTMLNMIKYLQCNETATMFIVDPDINNVIAIRCYEKCGFIKTKLLTNQWLMILKPNKD